MANQLSVSFGVGEVFCGVFKYIPAWVLRVLRLLPGTLHFLLLTPRIAQAQKASSNALEFFSLGSHFSLFPVLILFLVLSNQKRENYVFSLYEKYNS